MTVSTGRIMAIARFLLLAVLMGIPRLAVAVEPTTATGIPPFSSIGGGPFDAINLSNLNAHFSIPLVSKAGRGLPFNFSLIYDSSVWTRTYISGHFYWKPVDA